MTTPQTPTTQALRTQTPTPQTGAIYDIGYRSYDGPRQGRRYVWGSLVADSLRAAYGLGRSARSKVLPWLLVGFACITALIIVLITILTGVDQLPSTPSRLVITLGILSLIFVAAQAPGAVTRDLRFRTIPLYFSRPLTRFDYVGAKVVALTVAMFVFYAVPLTIVFAGALLARLPVREQTGDWLLGLGVALLAAVLDVAVALAIAAWVPIRGLAIAAIVTTQLVLGIVAVVVGAIVGGGFDTPSSGATTSTNAGYALLLSPGSVVEGLEAWITGTETSGFVTVDTRLGLSLVAGAVLLVIVCYAALLLRYRRVSI